MFQQDLHSVFEGIMLICLYNFFLTQIPAETGTIFKDLHHCKCHFIFVMGPLLIRRPFGSAKLASCHIKKISGSVVF